MDIQQIKQRFGIIGNDSKLNRALEKAVQVAPTDISVLVIGESGVGKEFIPKIIHSLSNRKHNPYIAVNCGAIPEGTIDSELFGHEKGAFTGADKARKGYFEVANSGTIFLDEVGELPLATQVRLLRVLETGEFIKVGSSEVQKTNVRIVAATNVNVLDAVEKGKFREDLYYRLNTVQIDLPPLRLRQNDIPLLFKKFANDFAEKYKMPVVQLDAEAMAYITHYPWAGNIRQLRNLAEQLSVIEQDRIIHLGKIQEYLPVSNQNLPSILNRNNNNVTYEDFSNERELLYKVLFDMKKDLNDLKSLTQKLMQSREIDENDENQQLINRVFKEYNNTATSETAVIYNPSTTTPSLNNRIINNDDHDDFDYEYITENDLSLQNNEVEIIKKALKKNKNKKEAAAELGISDRTLYRKIKQFKLDKNDN